MQVIKIDRSLPKRETFICDICGYEVEMGAFNPMYIHKTVGGFQVSATVCNKHFDLKEGETVYTSDLLKVKFEVQNKAKEIMKEEQS